MKLLKVALVGFVCVIVPFISHAQVVISEIMYDPTGSDDGREWVEIQNVGASDIDVLGWKFNESNTDHGLVLKQGGTIIPAGGFAVIVDDFNKFLADQNFSGIILDSTFSLSNDGEPIAIKNKDKVEVDSVAYSKTQGAAGNGNSLQKTNSGWISASPTPGSLNATVDTEPTAPPDSGSGSTSTSTATSSTATSTATSTSETTSLSSGGTYVYSSYASLSNYDSTTLNVEAGRERIAFLHTPIEFKTKAVDRKSGKDIYGATYYWTFGDGTSGQGSVVSHTYLFPGEYNVVLNSSSGSDDAVDITKVEVIEAKVSAVYADQFVEISNRENFDINVGEWKILGNDKEYIVPRDTIISANGSIKIPLQILGAVGQGEKINILYPDSQQVFETARLSEKVKQEQIAEISAKLVAIQNQLSAELALENGTNEYVNQNQTSRLVSNEDIGNQNTSKPDENASLASASSPEVSKTLLQNMVEFITHIFK